MTYPIYSRIDSNLNVYILFILLMITVLSRKGNFVATSPLSQGVSSGTKGRRFRGWVGVGLWAIAMLLQSSLEAKPQSFEELVAALEIAAYWDRKLQERFPLMGNHLLSTGYFATHSARMRVEGEMGVGAASLPPYSHLNGLVQPLEHLELTINYRVFRRYRDPILGAFGFGDYADRGANVKYAFFTPEESLYQLPGFAVGIDDFMGSKKFTTYYLVTTQVWPEAALELSIGWGAGRYSHGPSRGFFGALAWFPLWENAPFWVRGLGMALEYDPTNYLKDPHPLSVCPRVPLNCGVKYSLCNFLEISASWMGATHFAGAAAIHYNWGKTLGFLPKIKDPPLSSREPMQLPLGCIPYSEELLFSLKEALSAQGFQLTALWLAEGELPCLWLQIVNRCYRYETTLRSRLQAFLAAWTSYPIARVIVIVESHGMPCQRYTYSRELLARAAQSRVSGFESALLTPRDEFTPPPCNTLLFSAPLRSCRPSFTPRFETFLGSASGKYKYALGPRFHLEGMGPYSLFYEAQLSETLLSTIHSVGSFDLIHPSQLPNVATDYVLYRKTRALAWDQLYLQKSWNLGVGCFGRVAAGYFQINYAGVAGELLWYPAQSTSALGLEGALVKKRRYTGLGFQNQLRTLKGTQPTYQDYFLLHQWQLSFYQDWPTLHLLTKLSGGQFLARDLGVRLEVTRYFASGLRLSGWISCTNAYDCMHGERYFDRGIALELPLDLFYSCSSRRVWSYAVAAWLRDAGYLTTTGHTLFDIVNRERR